MGLTPVMTYQRCPRCSHEEREPRRRPERADERMWHHFRQRHFAESPLGLTAETRTVRHPPLIVPAVIAGTISAGLAGVVSSLLAALLVDRGSTAAHWIVWVGTVFGAFVGGWWAQPRVARLVRR